MLPRDEKGIVRDREQQLDAQNRQQQGSIHPFARMDRLFDEFYRRPFLASLLSPGRNEREESFFPVDIYEDNESVVVKAEIPGIRREDLDVQLGSDSITISGEKSSEDRVEQRDFFRLERSYGSFTRKLQLPAEILTDQARATFRDGVLEVRIPKSLQAGKRMRRLNVE